MAKSVQSPFYNRINRKGSDLMGIQLVVDCLLNRGASPDPDTLYFKGLKHKNLIEDLIIYLDSHRHFLGYCRLESAQALNDRGVDLFLNANTEKIGFQIKSDYDVSDTKFAANVKRQFTEALSYPLTHYFILICAPVERHKERISQIMNEMASIKKPNYFSICSPNNLVISFRDKPMVTREELLTRRAITDDALFDYERGYEHLPEVMDDEIEKASNYLDEIEIEGFDLLSEEWYMAYQNLLSLVHQKKRLQFETVFYPNLPSDIKQKREELIKEIQTLLQKCRECESWDKWSEHKLSSWIENIPEEMIAYTSIPNLIIIINNLKKYYRIHLEEEANLKNGL